MRRIYNNGANGVAFSCPDCKTAVESKYGRPWIGKDVLEKHSVNVESLPISNTEAVSCRCVVCWNRRAELHHWAPRELFGDEECNRWPMDYLCPDCHRRWHEVINTWRKSVAKEEENLLF
jgi:Zn finger protein HypA/HybF involved in hydrogenase expression